MKYKAKYNRYDRLSDEEILHKLLKERGVEDTKALLNLTDDMLCSPKDFNNMQKGLDMLFKHLDNSTIAILVDQDCDGYTSGAFTYCELKKLNNNIELKYIIHEKKTHGIKLEEIKEQTNFDFDLLIIPDASSSEEELCNTINEDYDKDILILDHHEFEKDFTNDKTVIINCKDGSYKNNTLAGVGVTYKFFHFYEELTDTPFYSDELLDLVAVGCIADSVDLRNLETRRLCLKGIDLFNSGKGNLFLQEIVKRNESRIGNKLSITKIGWNIAPLINAVARMGKMEEKIDMFKALIGSEEIRMYQPRRKKKTDAKPEPIEQTIQEYMARVISNVKTRQDKKIKTQSEELIKVIKDNELDKRNKIIMLNVTNTLDQAFTGYVAGKIANYFKRPVLLMRENKDDMTMGGSGRNYNKFAIDNLKKFLLDTQLFNKCGGHDNAFGIDIDLNKLEEVQEVVNKKLSDVKIEDVYHVDYAIPMGRLRPKHILQIGKFEDLWGNGLDEPLFAITDVYVNLEDIKLLGEKQNVLKITKNLGDDTVSFINLMNGKTMYEEITGRGTKGIVKRKSSKIGLDIIGKFKINHFNDNEYPEIQIVDFNLLEEKKVKF